MKELWAGVAVEAMTFCTQKAGYDPSGGYTCPPVVRVLISVVGSLEILWQRLACKPFSTLAYN